MYNCKSSPLLTFERRHAFNKKMSRPVKKRVRIQPPLQQFRMSNPYGRHSKAQDFLPQRLLAIIANLEFLTYSNVGDIAYEASQNFKQDLEIMRNAVNRQEASIESTLESIRRSYTRYQTDKPKDSADQKLSRFYDGDSNELFPITQINDVSFSLGEEHNLAGLDSTDTEKPKNYCYTEAYLPAANRAECDAFFAQ